MLDVAVDVRLGSPTFGRHVAVELDGSSFRQLWIPRGFAHERFRWFSPSLLTSYYRCDELYSPSDEIAIRWDDPAIGIDWPVNAPTLSAKDAGAPPLSEIDRLPRFGDV